MGARNLDLLEDHETYIQDYHIHLTDGTIIETSEEYYKPVHQRLIARYTSTEPDSLITVGDQIMGFTYIPKRNIFYINTAAVRKVPR